jgi:hypothetical protein
LDALTSLPSGVEFENREGVYFQALTSISPGVEFKNRGYVWLSALIGGEFSDWSGNIEGIGSNRLLNMMIKQGVFKK